MGTPPDDVPGGGGGEGGGGEGSGSGSGSGSAELGPAIYANSEATLYKLDPVTHQLTVVGDFDCVRVTPEVNDSLDGMTDIAADASGQLFGIGVMANDTYSLVQIDRATAHCQPLMPVLVGYVGGLTFTPVGVVDTASETLMGVDINGVLSKFDVPNQVATPVGTGGNWDSKSADLVSIDGDSTYSTAYTSDGDHLLVIDPRSGGVVHDMGRIATDGGAHGVSQIFGLGYWGGVVYGFTWDGHMYSISTTTAAATYIPVSTSIPGLRFVGAAVTTSAPIVLL